MGYNKPQSRFAESLIAFSLTTEMGLYLLRGKMPVGVYKRSEKYLEELRERFRKINKDKKGKHLSIDHRKKIGKGNNGKHRSAKIRRKISKILTGKHIPDAVKKKMSDTAKRIGVGKTLIHERGKNAAHYKGGITLLRDLIRHLPEYKQWRSDVYHRDNYTCQTCGARSQKGKVVYLEAHHTPKEFANILTEFLQKYNQFSPQNDKDILVRLATRYKPFWDVSNGITLCKDCHELTKKGKKQRRKNG